MVTVHENRHCGQPLVMGEDESGTYWYCPQCDLCPPDDEMGLVPVQPHHFRTGVHPVITRLGPA